MQVALESKKKKKLQVALVAVPGEADGGIRCGCPRSPLELGREAARDLLAPQRTRPLITLRQQWPSLFPAHSDGSSRAPSPRPPAVAAEPSSARRSFSTSPCCSAPRVDVASPRPVEQEATQSTATKLKLKKWCHVICTSSLMHCVRWSVLLAAIDMADLEKLKATLYAWLQKHQKEERDTGLFLKVF
ncbi:unnamed protein product [Urochloa humidicola]